MKSLPADPAQFLIDQIGEFTRTSPLNRLSLLDNKVMFEEPLVQFADADDPIFTEYKSIIDPCHLTPREVMDRTFELSQRESPGHISVISWILPVTARTRESNRRQKTIPSRLWAYTRIYGEQFNEALREFVVKLVSDMGYRAVAPLASPFYATRRNERGRFSNWSERHIAYAAGLGTFSLSDGFITESGIAHRCGSVVTDLVLPANPRTATGPYANCLFYADGSCSVCVQRCPAGAISTKGHDKIKCGEYLQVALEPAMQRYNLRTGPCGLCQTKVPCEHRNPVKKAGKTVKKSVG